MHTGRRRWNDDDDDERVSKYRNELLLNPISLTTIFAFQNKRPNHLGS